MPPKSRVVSHGDHEPTAGRNALAKMCTEGYERRVLLGLVSAIQRSNVSGGILDEFANELGVEGLNKVCVTANGIEGLTDSNVIHFMVTPLVAAIQMPATHRVHAVTELMRLKADPNLCVPTEHIEKPAMSPMFHAASCDFGPPVLQALALAKGDLEHENGINRTGLRPLHVAAYRGHLQVCRYLLHAKVDPNNARLTDGTTPLHMAILARNLEVVRVLISSKADIELATYDINVTPMHMAAQTGDTSIALLLLKNKASVRKYTDGGDEKLSSHVPVTDEHNTPLMRACANCHYNMARMLIDQYGASVTHKTTTHQYSALDYANHAKIPPGTQQEVEAKTKEKNELVSYLAEMEKAHAGDDGY